MSFLRSMGHQSASAYPLAYLWNEVRFARAQLHARIGTEAVVMHAVIVQSLSGGEHLSDVLGKLSDVE